MQVLTEAKRADAQARLAEIAVDQAEIKIKAAEAGRELLASEQRKWNGLEDEAVKIKAEIDKADATDAALRAVPKPTQDPYGSMARVTEEARTYRPADKGGQFSFFADLVNRNRDELAEERMRRHQRETNVEQRAMTAAGGGIGLVPPLYLQDALAEYARAGRTVADLMSPNPLPTSGMSFNIPRVTTGTTVAVQSAEAAAVQDNSPVTDDITLTVNTLAGKVDVSRQLFDRSSPNADLILASDLAADYAKQLDSQLLNQATNGVLNLTGTNSSTVATATVTAVWPKFADAMQLIATNRFAAAQAIVMHPRRWSWFTAALDTTNRPLVEPSAQGLNSIAVFSSPAASGQVGVIQGLPVFTDANIPINLGAGTNQDVMLVARFSDHLLFEAGTPTIAVYEGVLSANLQVRILAYGYFAFTFARYPKSSSIISGAGLVPPTF
jgi:HK97 family phage major capsid protein